MRFGVEVSGLVFSSSYLVVLADTDVVVVDFLSRCVGVDINVLIGCRD